MFISVSDAAKKWKISDRMVRRYCIQGRIQGAYQEDEVWFIPEDAEKPARIIPEEKERPAPKPQQSTSGDSDESYMDIISLFNNK